MGNSANEESARGGKVLRLERIEAEYIANTAINSKSKSERKSGQRMRTFLRENNTYGVFYLDGDGQLYTNIPAGFEYVEEFDPKRGWETVTL